MIVPILVGAVVGFLGYVHLKIRPPPSKICGSPGGPLISSPRVKLHDGRHLAYKERGVAKEEARYKIIICHGFDDSKDFYFPISEEFINENRVYILSYDRAGYGESDPNPSRSVKSEAFDIQELADKLELGPTFYLIGMSMGAYAVYSCLMHIPHRLSGAALVAPFIHYWWRCFPAELLNEAFDALLPEDQWTFRIAHYTPFLFNWWMNQKWFPSLSVLQGKLDYFGPWDLNIIKQASASANDGREKVRQQGVHECLHRDMIAGFGHWGFELNDITSQLSTNEICVHIWQGHEDKFVLYKVNRYLSKEILPWTEYHEVPEGGHLLIYDPAICEAVFKSLMS